MTVSYLCLLLCDVYIYVSAAMRSVCYFYTTHVISSSCMLSLLGICYLWVMLTKWFCFPSFSSRSMLTISCYVFTQLIFMFHDRWFVIVYDDNCMLCWLSILISCLDIRPNVYVEQCYSRINSLNIWVISERL